MECEREGRAKATYIGAFSRKGKDISHTHKQSVDTLEFVYGGERKLGEMSF